MFITIQNFSNVYSEQPFMAYLRNLAKKNTHIFWFDCRNISGSDCYCDIDAEKQINEIINTSVIPANTPVIHFCDNGNYHYMSKIWTDRIHKPFNLIVFDHHPDMLPPRFGDILSCGGWVKKVLQENKFVQHIILIGVADHLANELQDEIANYANRLTIVTESKLSSFNFKELNKILNNKQKQTNSISAYSNKTSLYFSIDKDVFSSEFAVTNWDQGSLSLESLKHIITELSHGKELLGIDICGERASEFKNINNGVNTAQEADYLNNKLNEELVEFLKKLTEIPKHSAIQKINC